MKRIKIIDTTVRDGQQSLWATRMRNHMFLPFLPEMDRIGSIRLLFILKEFEGWQANPKWGDLTFYVKHGDTIERIAIVGDDRWRGEALMFASADLRRAPVEYFSETALAEARAWLAA